MTMTASLIWGPMVRISYALGNIIICCVVARVARLTQFITSSPPLSTQIKGQSHLNTSTNAILEYMDGTHKKIQNGYRCVVDIRDVAIAHITPIENNVGWSQRYLLFGGAPHFTKTADYSKKALEANGSKLAIEMAGKVLTELNETYLPTVMGPSSDKPLLWDGSPADKELGIEFTSVEDMITTCVNELLESPYKTSDQYDAKKL